MSERPDLFQRLRLTLEAGWLHVFPTWRGHALAVEYALDLLTVRAEVKTIASVLQAAGKGEQNHKPVYELFSESPWEPDDLFEPVMAESARACTKDLHVAEPWLPVAIDDTLMKKTSSKIPGVTTGRDPMSLPFHVNLVRGLRVIQASAVIPHYTKHHLPARAYPVASRVVPPVKKPGNKATEQEVSVWKEEKKQRNLNTAALEMCAALRIKYDKAGFAHARLLVVADGSYCNGTMLKPELDRTDILARCRKDARLCRAAAPGSRKKYDHDTAFTPEEIRKSSDHKWIRIRVFYGGKWRKIQVKVVRDIRWQKGGGLTPLTLIVIKPREYRTSSKSKTYYKVPAYLLTTATDICLTYAVRAYFGRGGIEDNFRDEKSIVGVNEAQVRCPQSARRYIPFATAVYSLMLLTSFMELGPTRTDDYHRQPRWRTREQARPTARDIIKLLEAHRARQPATRQGNARGSLRNQIEFSLRRSSRPRNHNVGVAKAQT
jgi:hypothetical protein